MGDASPDAPHGFFVDTLRVPLGRFRIPPNEFPALLPQQLLTLLTGADAVDDAAWQADWGSRAGVFVGIGLDMETGTFEQRWTLPERVRRLNARHGLGLDAAGLADWVAALRDAVSPALDADRALGVLGGIIASRLSREFRIGGPSFTVSADESSGLKALEAAAHFLRAGIIDRAVVGAVDLPADRFAAAAEFDEGSPDGPIAEGAVVLVVRRLADAVADADRIAAVLPAGEIAATPHQRWRQPGWAAAARPTGCSRCTPRSHCCSAGCSPRIVRGHVTAPTDRGGSQWLSAVTGSWCRSPRNRGTRRRTTAGRCPVPTRYRCCSPAPTATV